MPYFLKGGALTPLKFNGWNLKITKLKRKIIFIFQTSIIVFHVDLPGYTFSMIFVVLASTCCQPHCASMACEACAESWVDEPMRCLMKLGCLVIHAKMVSNTCTISIHDIFTSFFKVTFWSPKWRSPTSPEKVTYGSKRGHFEEPGNINKHYTIKNNDAVYCKDYDN